MTNSRVGNHQVAVVDVDEAVLEGFDMHRTHLNGFLVTNKDRKMKKVRFLQFA